MGCRVWAMIHGICVPSKRVSLRGVRKSRFTPQYEVFLERLRALREKNNIRQEDLAERLGVPQQYVSRFEIGETRMDIVQLWRYCRALDVSFTSFCGQLEREFNRGIGSRPGRRH